ncbi:MAG: radical SAM protein [Deltaproteobacteria bacterium]|nr:radical SAM protein [Deltaproteobacteria bacterium]
MTSPTRPALLGLPFRELTQILGGPGRALDVFRCLRQADDPRTSAALMPGARARLRANTRFSPPALERQTKAPDGTIKLLLRTSANEEREASEGSASRTDEGEREEEPGDKVETVLIPRPNRTTVCVSTQVGCARGCTFCLTATMGLRRNLEAHEIVAQVFAAISIARTRNLPTIRNVVFMGMGEPLDNLSAVTRALDVLSGGRGFGFGARFITVSTVGPSLERIRQAAALRAQLAWSLHSARDDIRRTLVPTQPRGTRVQDLAEMFREVCAQKAISLFVELTLMDGVNDTDEDIEHTLALFRAWETPVRFNLLPWNAIPGAPFRSSTDRRVLAFRQALQTAGHVATVRHARGASPTAGEGAACGQLVILDRTKRAERDRDRDRSALTSR